MMRDDLPVIEFAFPGPLRDQLVEAIQSGAKTTTSSLIRQYEVDDEPLPAVGDVGAVVDSHGRPVLVIQTVGVDVVALRDVPLAHALAEGEGYASVADWRRGHLRFWASDEMRDHLEEDFEVDDDTLVVLERFVVVP